MHVFTLITASATLPLIFIGGLVTSHDAALAVPDWPTSYGYNMFLFPWDKMMGGIFYEHTHRLVASLVGFLTMILAIWIAVQEKRRWVKLLGWIALFVVIFQGVLGGLRVILVMKWIAIFHACLAQAFFCLLAGLALFTSAWWKRQPSRSQWQDYGKLRQWVVATVVVVFIQLILGATMRHTSSGLAVPDFPTMYGSWTPPLGSSLFEKANDFRRWKLGEDPVTRTQIVIHLAHRLWAIVVCGAIIFTYVKLRQHAHDCRPLRRLGAILFALLFIQICLGPSVIWTKKAADIATAHVAVGALTLMVSFLLSLVTFKVLAPSCDFAETAQL